MIFDFPLEQFKDPAEVDCFQVKTKLSVNFTR